MTPYPWKDSGTAICKILGITIKQSILKTTQKVVYWISAKGMNCAGAASVPNDEPATRVLLGVVSEGGNCALALMAACMPQHVLVAGELLYYM